MVTSPETDMLQVGDRILEVNGTPVTEKSLVEVTNTVLMHSNPRNNQYGVFFKTLQCKMLPN